MDEFYSAYERCPLCGLFTEFIACHGCGYTIHHNKGESKIAHQCLDCNIEDGTGE